MRKMKSPCVSQAQWLLDIMDEEPFSLRHYGDSDGRVRWKRLWVIKAAEHVNRGLINGCLQSSMVVLSDGAKVNHFAMTDEARQFWKDRIALGVDAKAILSAWRALPKPSPEED